MRAFVATLLALTFAAPVSAAEWKIPNRDVGGLIRAIQSSNATPDADIIHLAEGGIYTLDLTDSKGLGLPTLKGRLQIQGHNAEIRRYGNAPMQLLEIAGDAEVQLTDLVLAEASRGALVNHGSLTLERVIITDSENDPAVAYAIVQNLGQLRIHDSLLGYNRVRGVSEKGGIVVNNGALELFGTRFIDNEVVRSSSHALAAGAVLNHGSLAIDGSVFENNTVESPDGELVASTVLDMRQSLPSLP